MTDADLAGRTLRTAPADTDVTSAATRYLERTGNADLLPMLGLRAPDPEEPPHDPTIKWVDGRPYCVSCGQRRRAGEPGRRTGCASAPRCACGTTIRTGHDRCSLCRKRQRR